MILFVAVIALALLAGLLLRGSIRRFEALHLRWWGLVLTGLALQFVPLPSGRAGTDLVVRVIVLSASYGSLVLFAGLNIRLPGIPFVLIGLALNAAVIIPNGGMPVSRVAIERSGQHDMLELLIAEGAAKHHLLTEDDILTPLADVIAIPKPIGQIISVGDVFVYAGIAWLIVAVMRERTPATTPGTPAAYRGKHRRQPSGRDPDESPRPARATTSGSAP